jgi:hypothetical protein
MKYPYPQTVRVKTNDSVAEATKEAQGKPWVIRYPAYVDKFYGTRPRARARMKTTLAEWDELNEENIDRKDGFAQVAVWPGTTLDSEEVETFEKWVESDLGARCQFLEVITTKPDSSGPGGRSDLFFAVHQDDIERFSIARLQHGMRWLDDAISLANGGNQLYPARVECYRSWDRSWGAA